MIGGLEVYLATCHRIDVRKVDHTFTWLGIQQHMASRGLSDNDQETNKFRKCKVGCGESSWNPVVIIVCFGNPFCVYSIVAEASFLHETVKINFKKV